MATIDKSIAASSALDALHAVFREQGLPPPPVPDGLAPGLVELAPATFLAGRQGAERPFDVDAQLLALSKDRDDRLLVAFGGHGTNSHALYYFLVCSPVALFVVRRWGNAYDDPERASRRAGAALEAAGEIVARARQLAARDLLPAGQWLVVADTEDGPQRCAWSDLSPESLRSLGSPPGVPALLGALMALNARART